jgi:uncharacterized protein YraI
MKKFVACAAFTLIIGLSSVASAAPGWSSGAMNLRAGPGANYPIVAKIPARAKLDVEGCLQDWSWCNVFWRGKYGWTSGRHVELSYQNRRVPLRDASGDIMPPVIVYNVNEYWDDHYRSMPFYGMRDQYGYNAYPVPVPTTNRPPMDRAVPEGMARSIHNRIPHMRDDRVYQ